MSSFDFGSRATSPLTTRPATTRRPRRELPAAAPAAPRTASRVDSRPWALRHEFALVFSVSAALLFALGVWVLSKHVVYDDAESRLTHAYMAIWDRPAKLATIGFIWPPLQTLALLPFVVIKPLATSMLALPLYSALWAGLMIASLNRTMALLSLAARWRYPLLIAWAANPLFLDYSANGMSEIQYMALMAIGLHYLIAWWLGGGRSYRMISISGVFMGLAFLTRYEVGAWTLLMAAAVTYRVWPNRRRRADVEAPLLLFLAPTVYMAAVWSGISMMVMGGGPLSWLTRAGSQGYVGTQLQASHAQMAFDVAKLTAQVSPALWLVPVALLLLALLRRDMLHVLLAAAILTGAAITLALMLKTPSTGLLQPRYNIRSLGPLVIGAGALVAGTRAGWRRCLVGSVVVAVLAAGVPTALHLMLTSTHGEERAVARVFTTDKSQEGTTVPPNYRIGTADDARIAAWIDAHVTRPKQVLIDDASEPGVILSSGRPILFDTLADHGEGAWLRNIDDPWGHYRYMVVGNPIEISSGFAGDLISMHFPQAYSGHMPGFRVILRNKWEALVAVAPRKPVSVGLAEATGVPHPASLSPAAPPRSFR